MKPWNADEIMPMREHVYRYLKDMILEGKYHAGDRLVERELAAKMAISRTPVREALFRLEAQGLVKTLPRKGVVVEPISKEKIIEIFDILEMLEGLAARRAAERIDEETRKECRQWSKKIEKFIQAGNQEDANAFHLSVCHFFYSTAKSPKLNAILVDLTEYIQAFARVTYEKGGRLAEAMNEHRLILNTISKGDAQAARKLSMQHIQNSRAAYLQNMSFRGQE
ncbi:GntR family transcriptional regulator [Sporolactobacillus shoreicorticis]|uniref:GntR family transcriptional regulator n=1 Tax=Sporolactobacillus shoreicorticis TaxID=1923877 RepID=A0ABW5S7C0_9BACL|nr:GntR family transcriptional regulator [Sporolactobacillus shoreicorticis]MCO7125464.1 GntR family transcriptional regulator [Sporolactobacillus shoreicorticis]